MNHFESKNGKSNKIFVLSLAKAIETIDTKAKKISNIRILT